MRLCLAFLLLATTAGAQEASYWRSLDRSEGLPSDDVFGLCTGGPDHVWAATGAGLCRIEAREIRVTGPEGVPRLVAPAPSGGVYALYPQGVAWVRGDGRGEEWLDLPYDPARQAAEAMGSDPDGTLRIWLGEGAYVRPPGGTWSLAPPGPLPPSEITHQGERWRPTRGAGIERRRLRPRFRPYSIPGASRVHALAAAPNGTIWCGTENGLARVDGEVVRSVPAIDGTTLGDVTACAVDREGRVWIGSGSSFRGVYRLDPGGWRHLTEIDAYVHRITVDPTGTLWFATLAGDAEGGAGAWHFSGGAFHPAPALGALDSARVYDVVARDPSGLLWFATLRGLAVSEGGSRVRHYTPADGLRGEKVWCLCAARDGSLWIGYQTEHGASRLAQGRIVHYDVEDGLCDGAVWAIEEGRPGVLWFATRNGLGRFDGRRWSAFRNEEGLGPTPIWPLLPLQDGSLWIGTLGEGLVHLVPDDRSAPASRFGAARYEASAGAEVTVRWSGHDTWFDTPAADLWYRWRLDGGSWSTASPATSVTLAPAAGAHRLEVQAIDRFGNAEDPPPSVEILVHAEPGIPWPPLALAALALLTLGFLLGRRAVTHTNR